MRPSFTILYPTLYNPGSFLNLYIKQKVAIIGLIFPTILEKCLLISCLLYQILVMLSHSPLSLLSYIHKNTSQDTWLQAQTLPKAAFSKVLCCLPETLVCIFMNMQSKNPTHG